MIILQQNRYEQFKMEIRSYALKYISLFPLQIDLLVLSGVLEPAEDNLQQ